MKLFLSNGAGLESFEAVNRTQISDRNRHLGWLHRFEKTGGTFPRNSKTYFPVASGTTYHGALSMPEPFRTSGDRRV
jgi:hypothetical protein